ncbi:hypothetical protein LWM68_09675 [Niabella sp. W65]|nr:hypothetical protein [Niabella sp. W65]MCH7363012.1 hypothetical protein [Niabella sp. W65]ULT38948.1 hypothetical protein KRR40_28350 [Niabella sp. I65]
MQEAAIKTEAVLTAITTFNSDNYRVLCDHLAARDSDLKRILETHDYPPMWTRDNSFESLVHIILEQQVSLASALAALNKLKEKVKFITPKEVLKLSDEEMKACFVSRQKTGYIRGLAKAIENNEINLQAFAVMPDEDIRRKLIFKRHR